MMTATASVTFASGTSLPIKSVEIIEGEGHHEMARVKIAEESPDLKRYTTGNPVTIRWGYVNGPQSAFIGYVSHREPDYSVMGKPTVGVVCIGASFRLKEAGYEVHNNVSASYIVRRIAEKFRLSVDGIEDTKRLHELLPQEGRTYWSYLQWLAELEGFVVWCRNTNLFFTSRRTAIATSKGGLVRISDESTAPGALSKFTPRAGMWSPDGARSQRVAYAVNPRTGTTLGGTNKADSKALFGKLAPPLFTTGETDLAVHSFEELRDSLAARERAAQQYNAAEVSLRGNPRIRVGAVVVASVKDSQLDSGLWYATKVRHRLQAENNRYEVQATLVRDAESAQVMPPLNGSVGDRSSRLVGSYWMAA